MAEALMTAETSILQAHLASEGYDPGPQDGALGPRTYFALFNYMAQRNLGERGAELGKGASAHFPAYDINSPLRIAHFMAQAAHETGGFLYLREIWGPTPAQQRYEGRGDLGNTQKGDGPLFRGRGIFQLTGRGNYAAYGEVIGVDLVGNPPLAEDPQVSVLIACAYWKRHGLNDLADADDIEAITRKINGGLNGLADRKAMLARAKKVLC